MSNCDIDFTTDIEFVRKVTLDNLLFSYISESKIHGFGLFAEKDIRCGSILGVLDGQVIEWDEYDRLSSMLKDSFGAYKNYIFMEWNAIDARTLLVRPFRTKYSYINHSYSPNVAIAYNPIRIITIKDIVKNEELVLDYTKEPLRDEYISGHGKTYL